MTHMELEQAKKGVGPRLRETRIARGITRKHLGKVIGANKAMIKQIESGNFWHPGVVAELAVALNVNPAWLQWGEPFAPMQIDYCRLGR